MTKPHTDAADGNNHPVPARTPDAATPDAQHAGQYATRQEFRALKARIDAIALEDEGIKYFHCNSTGADSAVDRDNAIAIGPSAYAHGYGSVVIGDGARFDGTAQRSWDSDGIGVVIGRGAAGGQGGGSGGVNNDGTVALGSGASLWGNFVLTIGGNATAGNSENIAIGGNATASGNAAAIALGARTIASGAQSVAVGEVSEALESGTVALGADAAASSTSAAGLGSGANASGSRTTAIGHGAKALAFRAVAIGAGSDCDRDNAVSVGAVDALRCITHVAPGQQDDDAATVSQLRDAGLDVGTTGNLTNAFVAYDDQGRGTITLPSTRLTGLRSEAASGQSTDAVTGAQLFELQGVVDADTADIATLDQEVTDIISGESMLKYGKVNSTGPGSSAAADFSVAIGTDSAAQGQGSITVGAGAFVNEVGPGVALGLNARSEAAASEAGWNGAVAIGNDAYAFAGTSLALGSRTHAGEPQTLAVGGNARASGGAGGTGNATAVGVWSEAYGNASAAFGHAATALAENAIALGAQAAAGSANAIAVGAGASAAGAGAIAIGEDAVATAVGGVALGAGSLCDVAFTVSVGSRGKERAITNVNIGTTPSDAINLSQLTTAFTELREALALRERRVARLEMCIAALERAERGR